MINISNEIKNACNSSKVTYREYIVISGTNAEIDIKSELYQTAYKDTHFIGTFNINYLKFITSNDISYRNKEFIYYKEINGNSIKIGSFVVTEIIDNDTNEEVTVTAYDYGLKFAKPYETELDYASGEITLFNVLEECCAKCDIPLENSEITNGDFIVDSNQFVNNEQFGDVISAIAFISGDFATINNNDKLELIFTKETDEIIEDYIDLDDKRDTRPITCLSIGTSQVQGQGAEIKDEELISLYGENWLIINDVPFAYTLEKREQLKNAIFEKVKGFGYSSFKSEYSFKPYLQLGDLIKFRNKNGELVNSIILRINSDYDNIVLEAPSITDSSVEYENPKKAYDIAKRAEIIANQADVKITYITTKTEQIEDSLNNNYYDKTSINEIVQTAESGVTNTFSEAGGNNIFRNTGLWFEETSDELFTGGIALYEYWTGYVKRSSNENATNYNSMLLQKGSLTQEQEVANGNYSISFYYRKLNELATASVVMNDMEYALDSLDTKQFYTGEKDNETGEYITQPLMVSANHVKIEFKCDIDNAVEVYDLMCNKGSVKLAYSQNQNETTTDTVNISKGITITSSNIDVIFKANADGIRLYTLSGQVKTRFTDKGMTTKEAIIEDEAQIVKTLWQEVGDQTWITRM